MDTMAGRGRNGLRHARPGLRSGLLAVLVILLSCGVVAMHSLGAGHPGMGHALGHDAGPAMSAHPVDDMEPNADSTNHELVGVPAASLNHDVLGCSQCVVSAAPGPDQRGGHAGLAMCLAVLSLLVWVVLRRQRQPFRMVRSLGYAGRRAFSGLVRGPPSFRTPSLSELCICRT